MSKSEKIPVIGILGGIGSGKSTVAAEFAKLGCEVIGADEIAHRKIEEPQIKKQIIDYFGGAVLGIDGRINHRRLAETAFTDAAKIDKLNSIVHPSVLAEVEEKIKAIQRAGRAEAIVLDIPLLAETGWAKRCDSLVFVRCDEEKRQKRVQKNALFDPDELKKREKFQISLDIKALVAENTVDNNSDLSALARQVAEIFPKIVRNG